MRMWSPSFWAQFLDAYLRVSVVVDAVSLGRHIADGVLEPHVLRVWGYALFCVAYILGRALASIVWPKLDKAVRTSELLAELCCASIALLQLLQHPRWAAPAAIWLVSRFGVGFLSNLLCKTLGRPAESASPEERDDLGFHLRSKNGPAWPLGLIAGAVAGASPGVAPCVLAALVLLLMAGSVRRDHRQQRRLQEAQLAQEPEKAGLQPPRAGGEASMVPERFLLAEGGDLERASQRFAATQLWREEHELDRVLSTPRPTFDKVKRLFPHFLHGRSRKGNVVRYERLGDIDAGRLAASGLSAVDLTNHLVFLAEYIFSHLDAHRPDAKVLVVCDVKGISIGSLKGEILSFLQMSTQVMQAHYPERMESMFIINAPFWFTSAWRVVGVLMAPQTRARIKILGANFQDELAAYIPPNGAPFEYVDGGGLPLGRDPQELSLLDFVRGLNSSLPHDPEGDSDVEAGLLERLPREQNAEPSDGSWTSFTGIGNSMLAWTKDAVVQLTKKPKKAHLGLENRFVFDHERQMWVLEDDGSGDGYCNMDEDPAEDPTDPDFGLVQAIQAAHFQSKLVLLDEIAEKANDVRSYFSGSSSSEASQWAVWYSALLYTSVVATQSGLECALALWAGIGASRGGLSFRPERVGILVVSAVILSVGLLKWVLPAKARNLAAHEPLRAFRIGCIGIFVSLTLLLVVPKYASYPYEQSPTGLAGISAAFAVLGLSSMLSRSAAGVLFLMARRVTHPESRRSPATLKLLAVGSELIGPIAWAGIVLGWGISSHNLGFPLDANAFLIWSGVACLFAYLLSLRMYVRIVGEMSERAYVQSNERVNASEVLGKVLALSVEDMSSLVDNKRR